jgi:hypothetical protein
MEGNKTLYYKYLVLYFMKVICSVKYKDRMNKIMIMQSDCTFLSFFSVHVFTGFNVVRCSYPLIKEIQFTLQQGNMVVYDSENIKCFLF